MTEISDALDAGAVKRIKFHVELDEDVSESEVEQLAGLIVAALQSFRPAYKLSRIETE